MKLILTILALTVATLSFAQNVNWKTIDENSKSIAYLNFGYDFGLVTQVGYGYQMGASKPILLTADYSIPMGENIVDDFKLRLGAQIPVYRKNNIMLTGKIYGIFRRHETSLVRMASFGSELGAVLGYYKPNWHIAAEYGFDKSIVTHLKHSTLMKENYASIKDGWVLATGGHFYFGLQAAKAIGDKCEVSIKLGGTNAQGKDEDALLPYYTQFGLIYKFSKGGGAL